jgi:carboxyl-terminal processing protease
VLARLAIVAACLVALLCTGIWLGGRHPEAVPGPIRTALLGDQEDARVVARALDEVRETFYREVPGSKLADLAIAGMVDGLEDRFSAYFDAREYEQIKLRQSSAFNGIGVQVARYPVDEAREPRGLTVRVVYDEAPAERAGLRVGDRIVGVDGKSLKGVEQEEAVRRIKGPAGTEVRLTIRRDRAEDREVRIRRATVSVPVVASELEKHDGRPVGVLALAAFSSGAHAEVYQALRDFERRAASGVVLDLRGNGGGFVNEAQLIASAFLTEGPIVTTRGRGVKERTLLATGQPVLPTRVPVVVLVDGNTASASEIVAGALQDRDRATVVGEKTYGKGVFQEVIELPNGGALDITAGKYFTPGGRNLGGTGIRPDVKAVDDLKTQDTDEALQRALQVLASKSRS